MEARAELSSLGAISELRKKLRATLFREQLAFIDLPDAPFKAACCSRRAGKTQMVIRTLLERAMAKPRSICVYFGPTITQALKTVWNNPDGIPTIIKDLGLDVVCTIYEGGHRRVDFKNGSIVWVSGCETLPDARHWRGPRYDLAVIDEAQEWPDDICAYMIDEVLAPASMDRWGEIWVTGTPGSVQDGLFWRICSGQQKGWAVAGWTCFENPHIDARRFMAKELARRGLQDNDPIIQREFFGRWVTDWTDLLYTYMPGRNDYETLPQAQHWRHVLGIDVGVRDLATYTLASYRDYDPTVYIQESYGEQAKPDTAPVTRMAEVIQGYRRRFGKELRLVMDCGALGLGYALELRNRHRLNITAAKKQEKAAAIRLLNDQLRLGRVKLSSKQCAALAREWMTVKIDPKTQIERKDASCDHADSSLYAWRTCFAYLAKPEPDLSADAQRRALVDRVIAQRMPRGQCHEMAFGAYDS